MNTPLATVASLLVNPDDLASALSLNTMMFFIGGSFGTALFTSIVINTAPGTDALNPFHVNPGAGFSNPFVVLVVPIAIGLALSAVLPRKQTEEARTEPDGWRHDCQVPWSPELERTAAR
ncbi:MAG: hypothetical protein U9N84_01695 [Actinomycetota bacterium]|nr:hypothetical protein [Actinomycetota bacterium]